MIKLSSRGCVRISMNFTIKFRHCNKYESNLLIFSNKKKKIDRKTRIWTLWNWGIFENSDFRIIRNLPNWLLEKFGNFGNSWNFGILEKSRDYLLGASLGDLKIPRINPDPSDFRDLDSRISNPRIFPFSRFFNIVQKIRSRINGSELGIRDPENPISKQPIIEIEFGKGLDGQRRASWPLFNLFRLGKLWQANHFIPKFWPQISCPHFKEIFSWIND